MAVLLTSTSGYIRNNAPIAAPLSVGTIAIRVKPNWNHNDGAWHVIWNHAEGSLYSRVLDFAKYLDNNIYLGWYNSTDGFDYRIAAPATATMFTSGVWQDLVFTWSDAANRQELFAGGISVASSTSAFSPFAVGGEQTIGNINSGNPQLNADATFSDYALWSAILTAPEINSYHRGLDPKRIRGDALQRHLPLFGNTSVERDLLVDDAFVVSAGTKADNPRRIRPRPRFWSVPVAAAAGALAGTSAITFSNTGQLAGAGSLAGASLITFANTATLQGGVAVAGIGTLAFTNTAALAGTAALAASSANAFANSATLLGAGAIAGTGAIVFTEAASLTGAAVLAGAASQAFTDTATLLGAGALAGSSALTFANSGLLILPAGSILGTAAITFADAATLTATGALVGSSAVAFDLSATITGQVQTSGVSAITFTNSAALIGEGALAGTSQLLFTNTGSFVLGDISGFSSLSFTPQGVLLADGALAGPSVLQFLALASLIDASAPTNPTRLTLSDAGLGSGSLGDTGIGTGSLSDAPPS